MHVLSVSSLKGGVGKTTVTLGLASAAFARGVRTLVVDLDPQSDASTGLDVDVSGRLNVADVLSSPKEKIVQAAIVSSGWARQNAQSTIDVMIGSPSAINFDGPHPSIRDIWKLEEALAHVESDYDLVLIDCAPSLNALTRTAWAASDRVAVITEPGLFSVAAADRALRAVEEIRRGLSPRLQPLGIIVNRARVQSLEHQFRISELREMFGPLVLTPQLPERTSLQQAQGAAKPLHMWPGESAEEMAANFDQLLDRVLRGAARQLETANPGELARPIMQSQESHLPAHPYEVTNTPYQAEPTSNPYQVEPYNPDRYPAPPERYATPDHYPTSPDRYPAPPERYAAQSDPDRYAPETDRTLAAEPYTDPYKVEPYPNQPPYAADPIIDAYGAETYTTPSYQPNSYEPNRYSGVADYAAADGVQPYTERDEPLENPQEPPVQTNQIPQPPYAPYPNEYTGGARRPLASGPIGQWYPTQH